MYYSEAHDVNKIAELKQVIAFPLFIDKNNFEKKCLVDRRGELAFTPADFNDREVKGIFVKIRAVKELNGKWTSVIRTADDSRIADSFAYTDICEGTETWEQAIENGKKILKLIL